MPSDASGYAAYWRDHRVALAPGGADLGSLEAVAQAEAILSGTYPAFGKQVHDRGFPPAWGAFLHPAPASAQHNPRTHWSKIDLETLPADVKLIWELARFSWLYPLARAYAYSGDPRYPQASLILIDSWMAANPPNCGGHWVSAHPTLGPSFTLGRVSLAWAVILYGLAASILPVWLLLAPRDYLSTFVKLGTVLLLALLLEFGVGLTQVVSGELRVGFHSSREQAAAQGAVGERGQIVCAGIR